MLIAVGMVFFMAYLGYYDGRKDTQGMVHWFAGLAYQAALYPIYGLAVVLLSAPAGGISRRNAFRAELATLGLLALASLGISVLITVGFHGMAAVLPPVTWHGREFVFTAPRLHCLWLPPLLVPFAWITVALRPKPLCTTANVVLGPAFVLSHWLMNSVPYQRSVPLFVGISILLFAVAFVVRRRWWEQADLAI